nr:MAG TPA: hypothetical protein [Bacteriophage sp.]
MTKEYLTQNTRTRCIFANEKSCGIFAPIFWGRGGCNSEVVHRKDVKNGGWRDSPHALAIILFFFINCKYIYIMYARTLYIVLP